MTHHTTYCFHGNMVYSRFSKKDAVYISLTPKHPSLCAQHSMQWSEDLLHCSGLAQKLQTMLRLTPVRVVRCNATATKLHQKISRFVDVYELGCEISDHLYLQQ